MFPLVLLFTSLALAQDVQLPAAGTLRSGPVDKPDALRAFAAAGQTPDLSYSGSFGFANGSWTWGINITSLAVPDTLSDLGTPNASFSKGYRVAHTQYQLEWPGMSETLQGAYNTSWTLAALSMHLPDNLTVQKGNSCPALLGSACVSAIVRAVSQGTAVQVVFPECAETIGANGFTQPGGAGTRIAREMDPEDAVYPNSTVFYSTSKTFTDGETAEFNRSKSAVQVLALGFEEKAWNGSQAVVMCQILKKGLGTDESAKPEPGSAASSTRSVAVVMFGVAVLTVVGVML